MSPECVMPADCRWTIIRAAVPRPAASGARPYVLARCACGTVREVSLSNLRGGKSLSCGCMKQRTKSGPPSIPIEDRLWAQVAKSAACWQWTGNCNQYGYGQIWLNGRMTGVHRVSYELTRGPIPVDMTIDHLCRNKACVNPDHLEVVTREENSRRNAEVTNAWKRDADGVLRCRRGHDLDLPGSFSVKPNGDRACRHCRRIAERRRKDRASA